MENMPKMCRGQRSIGNRCRALVGSACYRLLDILICNRVQQR
uniref:Uncharacterized protein n=1 Tax=Rhizophora mucronata TaxID=61149 RepID=A0A2P2IQC1_RHIMU